MSAAGDRDPVLITGAGGFLGAWLAAELLARGRTVAAFDRREERGLLADLAGRERALDMSWTTGDITDTVAVEAAFEKSGARSVVHLAALTIPDCRRDPARAVAVNVIGHVNVLEAARRRGIAGMLYTSSIASHPRGELRSPANIYGVTKRAVEDISKVYFLDHGITSVGLRPNVVYGYGRAGGETAAVSEAIRAAALGQAYAMPFAGAMSFQYVGEIVDVMIRCLDAAPERPVVSDVTTRVETVDDVLAAISEAEPDARIAPSAVARAAPDIALDNTPLRTLIGDWPAVPLREGVARTMAIHRKRVDA